MSTHRRIETYIQAVRALRTLQQAQRDEPTTWRLHSIIDAGLALRRAEGALTGGMKGRADHLLREVTR